MKQTSSNFMRTASLVFFITHFLTIETAAVRFADAMQRTRRSTGEVKAYYDLRKELRTHENERKYLSDFEVSAKCPFKVFKINGFLRVICDFTKCSGKNEGRCKDCEQGYITRAQLNTMKRPTRRRKEIARDVEMGCIYNPKQSGQSIETKPPRPSVS